MEQMRIPEGYYSDLNLHDTQVAIKTVKDFFQQTLAQKLNLLRVSAPVFVSPSSGLNDNLNGVERPVSFDIKGRRRNAEIVHSLAKWKRYALKKYGFARARAVYGHDRHPERRGSGQHPFRICGSVGLEKIISREERTMATLISTVRTIYSVLRQDREIYGRTVRLYRGDPSQRDRFRLHPGACGHVSGLHSQGEGYKIVKEKGAVFLMQVGKVLSNGERHDGRAPDYDDWELNGDILVYYPVLDIALELSSMGIRVDEEALAIQLKEAAAKTARIFLSRKRYLTGSFPIPSEAHRQSRICMFFLRKAHIGEVHVSLWPKEIVADAEAKGVQLL